MGLDQLSTQKGDALLVVDGEATRIATAMTPDALIERLPEEGRERDWLHVQPAAQRTTQHATSLPTALTVHPMELLIEKLNGFVLDNFDFDEGKFRNRSEAIRRLGKEPSGPTRTMLARLEEYIMQHNNNSVW